MREAEDNSRLGVLSNIKAQIEMLDVAQSTEHILQSNVQAAILQDLSYTAMTNRYETLAESHPKTYDWAFQKSTDEQLPWDNFSVWLKSGRGVYWVSGKPGSGKSTLMKYIFAV
jgi:ABC-type bacteriocin/lantibiotic exporter with double-glycine peptidase domain